ncbi:MAG: hypothetical protein ACK4PC_00260 [Sphingopyxis sp.]
MRTFAPSHLRSLAAWHLGTLAAFDRIDFGSGTMRNLAGGCCANVGRAGGQDLAAEVDFHDLADIALEKGEIRHVSAVRVVYTRQIIVTSQLDLGSVIPMRRCQKAEYATDGNLCCGSSDGVGCERMNLLASRLGRSWPETDQFIGRCDRRCPPRGNIM